MFALNLCVVEMLCMCGSKAGGRFRVSYSLGVLCVFFHRRSSPSFWPHLCPRTRYPCWRRPRCRAAFGSCWQREGRDEDEAPKDRHTPSSQPGLTLPRKECPGGRGLCPLSMDCSGLAGRQLMGCLSRYCSSLVCWDRWESLGCPDYRCCPTLMWAPLESERPSQCPPGRARSRCRTLRTGEAGWGSLEGKGKDKQCEEDKRDGHISTVSTHGSRGRTIVLRRRDELAEVDGGRPGRLLRRSSFTVQIWKEFLGKRRRDHQQLREGL